jgi:hypothetical protein
MTVLVCVRLSTCSEGSTRGKPWGEREVVIDGPTEAGDFILSDKTESDLIKEGRWSSAFWIGVGGLFGVVGAVFVSVPSIFMALTVVRAGKCVGTDLNRMETFLLASLRGL